MQLTVYILIVKVLCRHMMYGLYSLLDAIRWYYVTYSLGAPGSRSHFFKKGGGVPTKEIGGSNHLSPLKCIDRPSKKNVSQPPEHPPIVVNFCVIWPLMGSCLIGNHTKSYFHMLNTEYLKVLKKRRQTDIR